MLNRVKRLCLLCLTAAAALCFTACGTGKDSVKLPVLMYHHFIESGEITMYTVVTQERFEEQIAALHDAGYNAVSPQQLIDFVENDIPLPENPVYITMDDGYASNVELAAPILEKYDMCATVFVVGLTEGETEYPHSGKPLDPPRMCYEDAADYVASGVLTVQSHTYDMHQRKEYGFSGRDGVLQLKGESKAEYTAALKADFERSFQDIQADLGEKPMALAYPFGLCSGTSEKVLEEMGVKITLTTDYGVNRLKPGKPNCLRKMKRCYATEDMSGEDLVQMVDGLTGRSR